MENFFKTVRNAIKHWYIPLIVGILLILLGIYVLSTPLASYFTLAIFFSISFLFSGILEVIFALSNKSELEGWGWHLSAGILNAILGFILLNNPAISMTTLPLIVGFFAMFKSIQYISMALDLKQYGVQNWGWLLTLSIFGLLFSFILLWNPIFAGLTIVTWTAFSMVAAGLASILLSLQLNRLKNLHKDLPEDWKKRYDELKNEYHRIKKDSK